MNEKEKYLNEMMKLHDTIKSHPYRMNFDEFLQKDYKKLLM